MADGPAVIALTRCASYETAEISDAVRRSVDLLGGVGSFVRSGARVLLKPNLLKGSPPATAVATHPELVRAVIRLVRACGGRPFLGDSPGIGELRRVAERTGILPVLEQESVPLVSFEEPVVVKNRGRFQRFEIARPAIEADVIISLPKLKTHGMTTLTGAVKNLFGCVPGKRKVQWHFNTGVDHAAFALMLVELTALLRPALTIMDAVVGMEGNGPGSGDPRGIGVLVAGTDPVAVDVVAGAVVGVEANRLPVLRAARMAGIGETELANIKIFGETVSSVALRDFVLPPQEHFEWKLPEWMRRSLKHALTTRPEVDRSVCIRCGICWTDCPQQAISETDDGVTIDHRRCIRCYCCQEFCPQGAITVRRGWLLRALRT